MTRKIVILLLALFVMSGLFAAYEVGDIVDDFSWTDSNGEDHSISELVNDERAILIFWGGAG